MKPFLQATIVRDWVALATIASEWNALLASSRAATVFLTWEWVHAWSRAGGADTRPFVVTVRTDAGRLVGVAPHYEVTFRLGGLVTCRGLCVLGDYASGAEYPDWIVETESEAPVGRMIAETLARHGGEWDFIWMPAVAGWTGARERVLDACRTAGLSTLVRPRQFGYIELPTGFGDYIASLSRNSRSTLSRRTRSLAARGMTVERCVEATELPGRLQALFRLNHVRWRAVGQTGTFVRKPFEARFYTEFAPLALSKGWLRFFSAAIDGDIKALQYGYLYQNSFLQIQEGFDPAVRIGIGNVLRSRVIEHCIQEGVGIYDFLAEYSDHKRRWRATLRTGHDFLIASRGLRGQFLCKVGLWPTGRYLRPIRFPG